MVTLRSFSKGRSANFFTEDGAKMPWCTVIVLIGETS